MEVFSVFAKYFGLALIIFTVLISIVKFFPITKRYLELIGYFLLAVSLIWATTANSAADASRKFDFINLQYSLDGIMSFEELKLTYANEEDNEDLINYIKARREISNQSPIPEPEVFKTISNINNLLLMSSTLLIAVGRLGELTTKKKSVKVSSEYKNYRKRLKRGRKRTFRQKK